MLHDVAGHQIAMGETNLVVSTVQVAEHLQPGRWVMHVSCCHFSCDLTRLTGIKLGLWCTGQDRRGQPRLLNTWMPDECRQAT